MDRIVHICTKKKFDEFSANVVETSDSETNGVVGEIFDDLSICEETQAEPVQQLTEKGVCISCRMEQCDIILIPCFHIVVCSNCWKKQVESHENQCKIAYKNNKRKLALESKKVQCPCCENIVSKSQEFFMATIHDGCKCKLLMYFSILLLR